MKISKRHVVFTGLSALFTAAVPFAAFADTVDEAQKGVNAVGGTNNTVSLQTFFGNIINVLLFVVGAVAVLMIIIGAIRYVTSNGDQANVKSAKDTILYAIIGLVFALLAYAIVSFVTANIK